MSVIEVITVIAVPTTILAGWVGERIWDALSQPNVSPNKNAAINKKRKAFRKWAWIPFLIICLEGAALVGIGSWKALHFPLSLYMVISISLGFSAVLFGISSFFVMKLLEISDAHNSILRDVGTMGMEQLEIVSELVRRIEPDTPETEDFEDYSPD